MKFIIKQFDNNGSPPWTNRVDGDYTSTTKFLQRQYGFALKNRRLQQVTFEFDDCTIKYTMAEE